MGTSIKVELWSDDRTAGEAAIDAVMAEMHRIDAAMSPFKPQSELSRINREAAGGPVRIGEEMFALIERSLVFSRLSDGAFDISYAGVGHLYDYRERIKPTDAAIDEARAAVGYRKLILDRRMLSIRFARPGMRIDLGGFAKGHAVDRGAAILKRRGITNAIVTAGGDSRILGDRRGRPWTIGIRDPRTPDGVIAVLPLEDCALSTSGDYERYFDDETGVRCHHVIDPGTGKSPANDIRSVTVIAGDGLTSEALTKTMFVLGLEKGMRLVEAQPGADAVVVDSSGRLHYSAGLTGGDSG